MAAIVVIGGGEHARVVIDAVLASGATLAGYTADAESPVLAKRFGARRLGGPGEVLALARSADLAFVLGVGAINVCDRRQRAVARYIEAGVRFAAIVHSAAWVSPSAVVLPGAVVMAGAAVNTGARVGAHAVVNTGAVVEHDCDVGAFVMMGPAAAMGGGASVGDGSYLGLGCRVRDHIRVGANALVAMGAVVVRAVPDGAVVMGVPARPR